MQPTSSSDAPSTSHPLFFSFSFNGGSQKCRTTIDKTIIEMDVSCFTSADSAARNATRLYNGDVDTGDFWFRDDLSAPLPACSPFSFATSPCTVCVDQLVHAVCRNLSAGVRMVMEGVGVNVPISEDGCPQIPPVDDPRWRIGILISIICLFFLIAAVLFQCWRSKKVFLDGLCFTLGQRL
ncbi:uncharacterized protein LOC105353982 isoform X2 [Oryzias latipes]